MVVTDAHGKEIRIKPSRAYKTVSKEEKKKMKELEKESVINTCIFGYVEDNE